MAPSPARTRDVEPTSRASRRDADRPNKLRLWIRRRRGLLRPVALGVAGLAGLGVLALVVRAADPAGRAVRGLEQIAEIAGGFGFTVQEVIVEGRRHTPAELLRSAIGVTRGDATFGVDPHATKERLETLAWVQAAHVERRLPGTIVIRLEERQPFAIWQNGGRFAVIDREGRVVATERLDQFGNLPLVVGAGAARGAAALYDILAQNRDLLERTQAMVKIGERRWNLKLHNNVDVLLPEGQEAAAVQRLGELQREHRLLDRPIAAIDMRLPDRLVVRQLPQAAPPPPERGRSGRG